MGYIGRDNRLTTFTKQSITANGTLTDFTLEQGVGDSSSILVSVGGIVQQPDVAYSATGKTLSFTSAPGIGTTVWVVYLGKELHSTFAVPVSANADSQTGVGNGTTTPFTLSHSVINPQSIIVTLNGVAQEPTTDFTVSGTTLTFTTAPDVTSDIMIYFLELETADDYIHDGSVTTSSFAASDTMPAWNGSALTNLTAGNLTGTLPALDGSALTDIPYPIIKSTVDPTINENPGNGLGTLFLNHTTGNMWALTNATADQNVWTNVGSGTGHVENTNPTEANNPGPFTWNESASYQVIFAGATDPDSGGTVTHYKVDTITPDTHLSVSVEEVAAGQPHTFVVSDVPSNQNVTFRVRAKDNHGGYSSGITVSVTVINFIPYVATGGIETTDGDYKIHIFNSSASGANGFNVTQVGIGTVDYMVVGAGGGGGGGWNAGGGGGAGGYRAFTSQSLSVASYNIVVGGGGAGGSWQATSGNSTSFNSISSNGGGSGATHANGSAAEITPGPGGSGGGASPMSPNSMSGGAGNTPSVSPSQGNNGGNGHDSYWQGGGGGGGASAVGQNVTTANASGGNWSGGNGGAGTSNSITGTAKLYSGGGGGGGSSIAWAGYHTATGGGEGITGRGAISNDAGNGSATVTAAENGDENRGGGGGGGAGYYNATARYGANGGKGVVIIRYRYQ